MATRLVLAELAAAYRAASGVDVAFESVGGVDAAKRVQAGEAFDVVVLAADAIDKLIAGGRVLAGSRVSTWCARRGDRGARGRAAARHLSRSPAPRRAGRAQPRLFHRPQRHGTAEAVRTLGHRRRTARAASSRRRPACRWATGRRGQVELGFQQLSEMLPARHRRGRRHAAGCEIVTTFPAASAPPRPSPRRCARCSPSCNRPPRRRPSATTAWNRHRRKP
jgi:molybdate transport system substrate-binding protein